MTLVYESKPLRNRRANGGFLLEVSRSSFDSCFSKSRKNFRLRLRAYADSASILFSFITDWTVLHNLCPEFGRTARVQWWPVHSHWTLNTFALWQWNQGVAVNTGLFSVEHLRKRLLDSTMDRNLFSSWFTCSTVNGEPRPLVNTRKTC